MSLEFNDIVVPDTTTMEVVDQANPGEPTGCFISGHTIGSDGWKKAQRRVFGAPKPTRVMMNKKQNHIEIPPVEAKDELRALAYALTNIKGLTIGGKLFEYTEDAAVDLFAMSGFREIVQQWRDHLEADRDFTKEQSSDAASGPDVSLG